MVEIGIQGEAGIEGGGGLAENIACSLGGDKKPFAYRMNTHFTHGVLPI